jgi:hypothetical protein
MLIIGRYPARYMFSKVNYNSELAPGVLGIGDVLSHLGMYTVHSYQCI